MNARMRTPAAITPPASISLVRIVANVLRALRAVRRKVALMLTNAQEALVDVQPCARILKGVSGVRVPGEWMATRSAVVTVFIKCSENLL